MHATDSQHCIWAKPSSHSREPFDSPNTFCIRYYRHTNQSRGKTTGSTNGPATLPSMELHKISSSHRHTPTWQRDGWQFVIAPEGGIADELASVRVWGSKRGCSAARGETAATQQALLFHHGASGELPRRVGGREGRGGAGAVRNLKGRRSRGVGKQFDPSHAASVPSE